MKLLMISGDRSLTVGRKGAFWQTLEELRKHWERIDVLCPGTVCHSEKSVVQSDAAFPNVFLYPSPRGLWYQSLWILRKGKELYGQHRYNVMTIHDYPPFYNGIGAWLLHRVTSIPSVTEIHHIVGDPVAANVQEKMGQMLYPLYFRTLGRSAAAFRVVNSSVRDRLSLFRVPKEKIHLVPSLYLDHELLQPDPNIPKEYDIVFCGRLVANKGVEELITVAAAMRPPPRLLIIGDGPLRHRLQTTNDKRQTHVTFTGWLPSSSDVYRAIQAAKIFVVCSKSEGGPRVLLEAMALGLPVITTSVGIVPDVIRDHENGLITTGTQEDLAAKIHLLLSDEAMRLGLGQRARDVLQRFERRKLIREYAHFLQSFA